MDPHPATPRANPQPAIPPAGPRTRTLGVLGGIASGKSHVARTLAGADGVLIDADALAQAALLHPQVVEHIAAAFGPGVFNSDGQPDRRKLADVVFSDPTKRRQLEGWIHPRVRATIAQRLHAARELGVPLAVLDVPLLLENDAQHGLVAECDALVFVDAQPQERERRAVGTRSWPPGDVERREALQLPLDQKRSRATHVLHNTGSLAELTAAAQALRATLLRGPDGRP